MKCANCYRRDSDTSLGMVNFWVHGKINGQELTFCSEECKAEFMAKYGSARDIEEDRAATAAAQEAEAERAAARQAKRRKFADVIYNNTNRIERFIFLFIFFVSVYGPIGMMGPVLIVVATFLIGKNVPKKIKILYFLPGIVFICFSLKGSADSGLIFQLFSKEIPFSKAIEQLGDRFWCLVLYAGVAFFLAFISPKMLYNRLCDKGLVYNVIIFTLFAVALIFIESFVSGALLGISQGKAEEAAAMMEAADAVAP